MRNAFQKYLSLFNFTDPLDTWSALIRAGWAYVAFFLIAFVAIIPAFFATIIANALGEDGAIWVIQILYFFPVGIAAGVSFTGIFLSALIGWFRYLRGLILARA